MISFHDLIDDSFVEHDDVFMRLFLQTLEGDVVNGLESYQLLQLIVGQL
jgi:hypothetical protein